MTKIIAIGDIHGRDKWKKILEQEQDTDKVVFIGDYFDSWTESDKVILNNFKEILALKESDPDKYILLIGNHDFHYISDEQYSGFRDAAKLENGVCINKAIRDKSLQMAWSHQDYLFTHAGVTTTWAEANGVEGNGIADDINLLFLSNPGAFKFTPGYNNSNTGDDITQSPIWVRPYSLTEDGIKGWLQVVGHTTNKTGIKASDNAFYIDCNLIEYLIINDGQVSVGTVK